ncbi:acyltransferase family protein [Paenibacillus sp. FSL W8-1187]|uniref:acyltransferase family protein n=1 Tax=unclassified Paenibacillus TaxID=185978 RepID=UPI00129A6ED3|nr:acyltransferase family protein [Paenibacillus sp. B01]QGG54859.1 hypothetical protein GE073_04160 [Paenibacillus sp. B01]
MSASLQPPRERAIDRFKGLLVIGMVYGHVLQFFSDPAIFPAAGRIIDAVNLITFSGFVFSFGYVSRLAYYAKPLRRAAPRMLLAALKTLLAFYISGLAFRLFIDRRPPDWETLKPILLLQDMPGWSEFLLSFTYLTLAGLILFVPLQRLAEKPRLAFPAAALLLLTTFLPYEAVTWPPLGPLLGTRQFASFPVLQYFPYYLLGMLFARWRIGWHPGVLAGSLAASGLFVWLVLDAGGLPERFPPSIGWIAGPALALYGYYLLSRLMERCPRPFAPLEALGRNVLWCLLFSNLLVFSLKSIQADDLPRSPAEALRLALIVLAVVGFSIGLIVKAPRRSGR